jgi:hypothetical protein
LISRKAAGNDETLKGIYASLVELENLQNRTTKNLRLVNAKKLIAARLQQAPLAELTSLGAAAQYINPAEIRGIVSEEARQEILRQAPDNITVATQEGNQPIDVRYIKNEAYLTVPVAHIPGLPSSFPQLGNRTIHVRSTMGGKSMPIDEAREYYARPNRSDRRGNVEREPQSLTGPAGKSLDEGNLAARGFTRFRRHGRTGRDGRS